ncbi:hypothetical protein K505DRAFT_306284 [Melanomma pulvis-pyrius CBS 109.77]|uniref:Uncharacterized protein n=1 Tax=Melanomma pulvis-pyrius CBS 109.77 TaxID=1314802 RepID=A0A6A6X9U4_9PLEO|nr:hypothetical protein K505DRAFT_306284 [Melanomma pulvis-pyrius CBS 109.77]
MEYGAVYLRASRNVEEDAVSMLSTSGNPGPYQAYRPDNRRRSSESSSQSHTSCAVSPTLQQSLPPLHESYGHMGASIFGSRAALDMPYQEPVAMEDSTQFRTTIMEEQSPKPEVQATVLEGPNVRQYFRHPRHILEPWKPGFWIRFPWWGFGALFTVVLLTGVSAGILLASDGSTIDSWTVGDDNAQLQVYISVIEMIMNFLILFALAEGMVIRFWRKMLHGTTLSSMNDVYESSFLWPAFKRIIRLRFNVVAVACLLTAVTFIRGPLFQRASTISDTSIYDSQGSVNLKMAPFPIVEYFQSTEDDPRKQGGITTAFSNVLKELGSNTPLAYQQTTSDCGDYCTGKVKGFAFRVNCSSSTQPFDLGSLPEECKSCTAEDCTVECAFRANYELKPTFFSLGYETSDASSGNDPEQSMTLTSVFKNDTSCKGEVQTRTCSLTQVATDYTVVITNGTIDRLSHESNATIYKDAMPLNKLLIEKYWPLAFAALFPPVSVRVNPVNDFSRLQYTKCVNQTVQNGDIVPSCSNGTTLQSSLLTSDPSVLYATQSTAAPGEDPLCSLTWSDPMQDVLDKMQSLAFRITVDMANSDGSVFAPTFTGASLENLRKSWQQPVAVSGSRRETVYKTNRVFVALGVLISVAGVVAIFPLYTGFWEMGRKVSLNPLEVARAFGAPLMEGMDGNATPEVITIERGGMAVRYGALERFGDEKKLRVEETARATVRMPWEGEIFG